MNITPAVGLVIEDYYGNEVDTIFFGQTVDLEPDYFNGRVNSFTHSGNEGRDEGVVVRVQYIYEDGTGDAMDIEIMTQQMMEIILEGCDELLEDEHIVRESIADTLSLII